MRNSLQSHNSAARVDSLSLHIHINQNGLPDALNLGNDTFEIKCFGEHNFEDLLNVYRRGCWAEDQRSVHCASESLCLAKTQYRSTSFKIDSRTYLLGNLLLLVSWECRERIKFRANEKWYSSLVTMISDGDRVRRNHEQTLLNPRAWRYHSFTEFSVDFRERSNMNRMATASLQTSGSMLTNSRWPPKSHIENVMVVRRTDIVFSMKLTPAAQLIRMVKHKKSKRWRGPHQVSGYNPHQSCLLHTWP